jgi:hypothetical protein
MSLAAPTPPLLLTKRLTAFLHANLSPQIHTAALVTLSGKLLAHASSHPVSTLRTQCTVAASVWAVYASPSTGAAVADALPPSSVDSAAGVASSPASSASSATPGASGSSRSGSRPTAVTIQLSGGVLVARRLRCGLLFVCVGPAPDGTGAVAAGEPQQHQSRGSATPAAHQLGPGPQTPPQQTANPGDAHLTSPLSSPSEVESVVSVAPTTASATTTGSMSAGAIVQMRRQTEELARWLDDKLGTLGIPEEGSGIEVR